MIKPTYAAICGAVILSLLAAPASSLTIQTQDVVGTAEDEIQAAIEGAGGPVVITLGDGLFTVAGTISLLSDVTLEGSGATIIRLADGADVDVIASDVSASHERITVRRLEIDGNRGGQTSTKLRGIHMRAATDVVIHDVYVHDVSGTGVWVSGNTQELPARSRRGADLSNILVRSNSAHGLNVQWGIRAVHYSAIRAEGNGRYGVRIDHSEAVVDGIVADGNGWSGVYMRHFFASSINSISSTRNGEHGILVVSFVDSTGSGWSAHGNSVEAAGAYFDVCFSGLNYGTYGVTRNASLTAATIGSTIAIGGGESASGCVEAAAQVETAGLSRQMQSNCTCTLHDPP